MKTEKSPLSRRQLMKAAGLTTAAGLAALLSSCGTARRTGRRTARRVTRRRS